VSYTSTGVVLTVAAVTPGSNNPAHAAGQSAAVAASAKPAMAATVARGGSPVLASGLRRASGTSKLSRPVVVAGWARATGRSNVIVTGGSALETLRSWERTPVISTASVRTSVPAQLPRAVNDSATHSLPASDLRMGGSHAMGIQAQGWMGNHRAPVKILTPMIPRAAR